MKPVGSPASIPAPIMMVQAEPVQREQHQSVSPAWAAWEARLLKGSLILLWTEQRFVTLQIKEHPKSSMEAIEEDVTALMASRKWARK